MTLPDGEVESWRAGPDRRAMLMRTIIVLRPWARRGGLGCFVRIIAKVASTQAGESPACAPCPRIGRTGLDRLTVNAPPQRGHFHLRIRRHVP